MQKSARRCLVFSSPRIASTSGVGSIARPCFYAGCFTKVEVDVDLSLPEQRFQKRIRHSGISVKLSKHEGRDRESTFAPAFAGGLNCKRSSRLDGQKSRQDARINRCLQTSSGSSPRIARIQAVDSSPAVNAGRQPANVAKGFSPERAGRSTVRP